MTFETRILTITVEQPVATVCAYLCNPLNFPEWASGLGGGLASIGEDSSQGADPTLWKARTPEGEVTVRFSPANDYGVADHWVFLPDGTTIYIPLRAVANGGGTEVSLMLFRLSSMDAGKFEEDAQWVMRDLGSLKAALERRKSL